MSKRSFLNLLVIASAFLGSTATLANAAEFTPWGKVIAIQSGWVVDRMLVFHGTGPLINPNGCPIVTNGYIIKETDPARRTFYDMLLNGVLWQREVQMVIDGCFGGRPRIVSVSMRRGT
jgi:hypothetical protein